VRGTDRFGTLLLKLAHDQTQDRNIVIAPLPVSLIFAAVWDGTSDSDSDEELRNVFRWEDRQSTNIAGRMLLARFAKPKPYPVSQAASAGEPESALLKHLFSGKPEELWLSGAFLYRGEGSLSNDFMDRVKFDYGFTFRA
jgi:hypothetical protein